MSARDTTITDLGATTSIDVIRGLVSLEGRFVIDVGCGDMTVSRQLADAGARVIAVDPDADQAARNRAALPIPNVEFVECGAESLPAEDGSLDGVYFSYSLHHVPAALYPRVFDEVIRVLKPGGHLCVIEPTDCPLNGVMKFFHDETVVRDAAQQALVDLAVPRFETHAVHRYHSFIAFESFDDCATKYGRKKFNTDYTEADIRRPEVEAAFEAAGAPGYRFESPKVMMWLESPRS